ncbi:MAG: hypothetical protein JRI99_07810 [Deltaproteobacteria bacterium]|nr:hypothetical protein [Deltaproteobacteria bacterium]MBW2539933.1 hypothetical protein [Deltaproteobacteria bacterium]
MGNKASRPLQNAPFCPIPVSGSNFNPQKTKCIPVVKIFAFLGLEQNGTFFKGLVSLLSGSDLGSEQMCIKSVIFFKESKECKKTGF